MNSSRAHTEYQISHKLYNILSCLIHWFIVTGIILIHIISMSYLILYFIITLKFNNLIIHHTIWFRVTISILCVPIACLIFATILACCRTLYYPHYIMTYIKYKIFEYKNHNIHFDTVLMQQTLYTEINWLTKQEIDNTVQRILLIYPELYTIPETYILNNVVPILNLQNVTNCKLEPIPEDVLLENYSEIPTFNPQLEIIYSIPNSKLEPIAEHVSSDNIEYSINSSLDITFSSKEYWPEQ